MSAPQLIVLIPVGLLILYTAIEHVTHVFNSVAFFKDRIISLYFSQYRPGFSPSHPCLSVFLSCLFFIAYGIIVTGSYVFLLIFMGYLFGAKVQHPNAVIAALCFGLAVVRLLIFREGGQKAEVISWIVAVLLVSWLSVLVFTEVIDRLQITAPFLRLTDLFGEHHGIRNAITHGWPDNRFILALCCVLPFVIEIVLRRRKTAKKFFSAPISPWVLCHEVGPGMKIQRIVGRKYIRRTVGELLDKCRVDGISPLWVTTTYDKKIVEKIERCKSAPVRILVMREVDEKFREDLRRQWAWSTQADIAIGPLSYPHGFLVAEGIGVVISSKPSLSTLTLEPDIGYYSEDVTLVQKYISIYKGLRHSAGVEKV